MQHAGHAHVLDVFGLRGRDRRQIQARNGCAEHRPLARMLSFGGLAELNVELLPSDQLAVPHLLGRIGFHADHAVLARELIDRCAEARGRELQERLASRRPSQRQIRLIEIRRGRLAAGRDALIRRHRRVALNQFHAANRHGQFFGDQLRLDREDALTELALARVRGHAAVLGDGDPRVELRASLSTEPLSGDSLQFPHELSRQAGRAEADNQRARSFQKCSARKSRAPQSSERIRGHFSSRLAGGFDGLFVVHAVIPCAYRLMARSIRTCVKQRHNTPDIAC